MTLHPCIVGIDVSKATLDLYDSLSRTSMVIANSPAAVAPLAARWRDCGARIVFEATGSYDLALRQALDEAGVGYSRVSPSKARHFAKYAGFLAKTDKIDARMLARMASRGDLRPELPLDAAREILAGLHRRRDQLVGMRQMEKTRCSEAPHDFERRSAQRHIAFLDQEIADIERALKAHIAAVPHLKQHQDRLRQVPGIGPVAAATLLALMPELGQRSPKTIAALAGLAPFNHDSGRKRGQRAIEGGRKRVREALYMAAVAASRSKSAFATFNAKLRQAGKPPKLAFIALARKILVTLNAIIRDQSEYVEPKPKVA